MARRHFLDESRFCLQHQDGRIRDWWHRGERTLAACICHRHADQSPGVMVWGAIGYTSWLALVRIDGTLNSTCYISGVLRPMALPFIRALRFSRIIHDFILPVLNGPPLIREMFGFWPGLHIHQISRQ
ncbi:transposable element Tcb1 transposase [Trichonephila clavipes]|nr:transposable element Tcb1 transposase [Trichonephila clavipes]